MADSLDPPIAEQAETKLRCSAKPRLQTPAKRKLQVRAAPWNCPPRAPSPTISACLYGSRIIGHE
jgi:hypothetical protein